MNYTLYVDESGDFESRNGQWLISGVLFSESYKICERTFKTKFKSVPSELNLQSIKQFHLTEFRRNYGHEKAVAMADTFLNKLNKLPFDYHFLATINYCKHSLSSREKTYRLMLSDLLALCDTVLREGQVISHLDLVIATRTINGELQTTVANVNQDIINSLPLALEVDLTSKGMVELIGKHLKVHMDYANNTWGLVSADFVANLNYHQHHKNEKELLNRFSAIGCYTRFESFGNHEERRASIARRNGDLVAALCRWLFLFYKEKESRHEIEIQSVLFDIFNRTGTTGHVITIEAAIDRLWRSLNTPEQYHKAVDILNLLSAQLSKYDSQYKLRDFNNIVFKLRNLILIIDNHLGETQHALRISKLQNELVNRLGSNPDFFPSILDFKISEIETYINLLDFDQALKLSNKYSDLIACYNEIWTLLLDDVEQSEFDASRASIKSKMTYVRCIILRMRPGEESEQLINEINTVEKTLSKKGDISRLLNYKTMCLLKSNKPSLALNSYLEKLKKVDDYKLGVFDIFWFLRATNDALLNDSTENIEELNFLIEAQISYVDLNAKGHPIDLILRELALFYFQNSNKSKALKYVKRSIKASNLGNSEIASWLSELNKLHYDFISGAKIEEADYFESLADSSFLLKVRGDRSWSSLLKKYRYYSPY